MRNQFKPDDQVNRCYPNHLLLPQECYNEILALFLFIIVIDYTSKRAAGDFGDSQREQPGQ